MTKTAITKRDVAKALRDARDKMNRSGRHWVKGGMKVKVGKRTLATKQNVVEGRFSDKDGYNLSASVEPGDLTFCSWGGIKEVTKGRGDNSIRLRILSMEALVRVIDPKGFAFYEGSFKQKYERIFEDGNDRYDIFTPWQFTAFGMNKYKTFEAWWNGTEGLKVRENELSNSIIDWNDDEKRKWDDVKKAFTEAARTLR